MIWFCTEYFFLEPYGILPCWTTLMKNIREHYISIYSKPFSDSIVRPMPHLDVFWYHFNIQKTMPQNTFPTFFPYIFYIKKAFFRNKNLFRKPKYASPMALTVEKFQTFCLHHGEALGVTKTFIQ